MHSQDRRYLSILEERLLVCYHYRPAFGKGHSLTLDEFQTLYATDPFYAWLGLDHPLVYAAHRAAGGITSVYRQIGIGCEMLLRQIFCDALGLNETQVRWTYSISGVQGRRNFSLDARIALEEVIDLDRRERLSRWIMQAAQKLTIDADIAQALKGIVFEIRQGYKSKDSKRQNADMANAAMAYTHGYLPVLLLLSNQIDDSIAVRYEQGRWLILRGWLIDDPLTSTYAFLRTVIGYDLADFFQRHAPQLRALVRDILRHRTFALGEEEVNYTHDHETAIR